jgi:hypothetical protein
MATLGRRFVVVCALGLWLGGTTLYTGFVITIGHRTVSAAKFGLVTRDVTTLLNAIGAIALAVLFVNLIADRKAPGRAARWGRWATWALLAASLAFLFGLHAFLERRMGEASEAARFDFWHDGYKLVTAIQWGAGLIHLACVLATWRRADQATPDRTG